MIISFFEEYPDKENLKKLNLLNWPTNLYLGAKSLNEFKSIKRQINNKYVQEVIYWPKLKQKEGYWISPFSKRSALKRIFKELQGQKIAVMLDLELPTTQNPFLYLTEALNFLRNRKLIKNFIKNYSKKVYLAEYYPQGKYKEKILQLLGIHYELKNTKIIKMVYHSMHKFIDQEFIEKELKRGVKKYKDDFLIALGTIAIGEQGNEPLLSTKQLQEDLRLSKKVGIKEIILFRLAGLNKKYIKILEKNKD